MSVIDLADGGAAGGGLAGLFADWATKFMDLLGSPGAGLANALDSVIPVLPSEVILPLAGFAASRGSINLYAALVWTTIGSIVGSVVMYYIGAAFGRERVMGWAAKIPLVKPEEVEKTERFFRKHGAKAVFFGRMVPVIRSLISIPAGLERMSLPKFVAYTAAGSAIWNTIFVLSGYALGANWTKVEEYGGVFSKVVIGLIVLAVGYFVVSRLVRRRREREQAAAEDTGPDPQPGYDEPTSRYDAGRPYDAPTHRAPYRSGTTYGAPAGAEPARRYSGTVYGTPRRPEPNPDR
ncbi:MAG TPA: DedA family protein [Actinocatenispora sp.]